MQTRDEGTVPTAPLDPPTLVVDAAGDERLLFCVELTYVVVRELTEMAFSMSKPGDMVERPEPDGRVSLRILPHGSHAWSPWGSDLAPHGTELPGTELELKRVTRYCSLTHDGMEVAWRAAMAKSNWNKQALELNRGTLGTVTSEIVVGVEFWDAMMLTAPGTDLHGLYLELADRFPASAMEDVLKGISLDPASEGPPDRDIAPHLTPSTLEPYLNHAMPKVRQQAILALGRVNAKQSDKGPATPGRP